jgi:hypothetical protein
MVENAQQGFVLAADAVKQIQKSLNYEIEGIEVSKVAKPANVKSSQVVQTAAVGYSRIMPDKLIMDTKCSQEPRVSP